MKHLAILLLIFSSSASALGQAYPTVGALFRTVMVQSSHGRGTTFSIDVDGREYWITAKHILTGAKGPPYGSIDSKTVSLEILDPTAEQEHWIPVNFSVIDPGKDIDVVVLAAPHLLLKNPVASVSVEPAQILMGGDCEFVGFPYGRVWLATLQDGSHRYMPSIKRCTISSIPDKDILVLDGINNAGFSGGPVLYQTDSNQKIIAVISGYNLEPAQVIASAEHKPEPAEPPKTKKKETHGIEVDVNSGFIIAYSIRPVVEAIRKNPIGPPRAAPDTK